MRITGAFLLIYFSMTCYSEAVIGGSRFSLSCAESYNTHVGFIGPVTIGRVHHYIPPVDKVSKSNMVYNIDLDKMRWNTTENKKYFKILSSQNETLVLISKHDAKDEESFYSQIELSTGKIHGEIHFFDPRIGLKTVVVTDGACTKIE